jgi:hypothetical protein
MGFGKLVRKINNAVLGGVVKRAVKKAPPAQREQAQAQFSAAMAHPTFQKGLKRVNTIGTITLASAAVLGAGAALLAGGAAGAAGAGGAGAVGGGGGAAAGATLGGGGALKIGSMVIGAGSSLLKKKITPGPIPSTDTNLPASSVPSADSGPGLAGAAALVGLAALAAKKFL